MEKVKLFLQGGVAFGIFLFIGACLGIWLGQ